METLATAALALALLPFVMTLANIATFAQRRRKTTELPLVSILIPARNEEANIEKAVRAAQASRGVPVEIVVMDDNSTDATPAIVARLAADDPRVRLERAPPLPDGWAGKAHACHSLAQVTSGRLLLFVDADVTLEPDTARVLASHTLANGLGLTSGVPRQRTPTAGELLTVPMINLLMFGYLPFALMRTLDKPSLGAACAQLMCFDRRAYEAVGGHGAVPSTMHDGIKLARLLRAHGHMTDLVDGSPLATCRMYEGFEACWSGFKKNAREGMAQPMALPIWTALLLGAHVLPFVLLVTALLTGGGVGVPAVAAALSLATRTLVTLRMRESPWTIPLHPATVVVGLAIQWSALLGGRGGGKTVWKDRAYHAG